MASAVASTATNTVADETLFGALARETYLSLTTFRRDGTPVATPVWVVSDDGARLLVHTDATSGKVKRLRNNPKVRVAGCSSSGAIHGPVFDGEATLRDGVSLVEELIGRKYGAMARLMGLVNGLQRLVHRRPKSASTTLVITPVA